VGRVVTFYSYKGGVGRTMALANVAWILASNGKRVLVADWDLETPGLHRYLRPFLVDPLVQRTRGVLDAWCNFVDLALSTVRNGRPGRLELVDIERAARVGPYVTRLDRYQFPNGGSIDFMPAGRQDQGYSERLVSFNWNDFYDRLGGVFLDAMARDMRRQYDYVFVDSRTGLTDTAGICTVLLPDTVVICFTLNLQSIEGAAAVAGSIRRHHPAAARQPDTDRTIGGRP
jgi:MinD-like ATPase involved in chromosome partitioning or flagellar assembly